MTSQLLQLTFYPLPTFAVPKAGVASTSLERTG